MSDKKAGPLSGLKTMNPKARKSMFLFGGAALVVASVTGLMMGKDKQQAIPAAASLSKLPSGPSGDPTAETSMQYKKLVHAKDDERAAEAANKPGQMVLPKIAGLTDPNEKPEPGLRMTPGIAQPQQAPQQMQQQYPQQYAQQPRPVDGRQSPAYTNVMSVMQNIVKAGVGGDQSSPFNVIAAPADRAAQAGTAQANGAPIVGAQQSYAQGGLQQQPLPIIRGGESVFATLDTAVNSDYSGPVVATIRQGKFSGARLIGQKTLEQSAVVMKFTQMSPADGSPAFAIDAYAIQIADAKQFGQTGLAGSVDHHIFERWVLPAAAAFVTSYGASASQQRQTVSQNASTTTQTTDPLSPHDRIIVAAGALATPITNDLRTMSQRPITVTLESGTEIGILFAKDVAPPGAQQVAQPKNTMAATDVDQQARANNGVQPLIVTPPPAQVQAQPQNGYGNGYGYQQPAGYGNTAIYGQQRQYVNPYQGLTR